MRGQWAQPRNVGVIRESRWSFGANVNCEFGQAQNAENLEINLSRQLFHLLCVAPCFLSRHALLMEELS